MPTKKEETIIRFSYEKVLFIRPIQEKLPTCSQSISSHALHPQRRIIRALRVNTHLIFFFVISIDELKIMEWSCKMKPKLSAGTGGISCVILKGCAEVLPAVLLAISNLSVQS